MRLLFILITIFTAIVANAQAPALIPYQAIARDASGQPLANAIVNVRFSIHDSTPSGADVWQEIQTVSTSPLGLFTVQLGSVVPLSGVNWAVGSKFMQVELDLGNGFIDIGTQQMLSVPYALYAESSGRSISGPPGPEGPQGAPGPGGFVHYIGEQFGGGVVFHVWRDNLGEEHGLIVAPISQSSAQSWSNIFYDAVGTSAQSTWDGLTNTNAIIQQINHTSSAAQICADVVIDGYDDWYLPSVDELSLLWHNRYNVNRTLSSYSDAFVLPITGASFQINFWSSTEVPDSLAWAFSFDNGTALLEQKDNQYISVRAIRSF